MLKTLLKSLREYKKQTIISPILLIFEVLFDILIPYIIAKLIDYGVNPGNMREMIKYGAILLLMSAVSLVVAIFAARISAVASNGFGKNLRHDLFHKVQKFSFSNIDKFSTGSIVTRLTTDINSIQMAFMMAIRIAIRAPMTLILSFFMVLKINARLSLIFICAIPILAFALILIMLKARVIFQRVFTRYDALNNVVQENLRGIRVVKAFVRGERENEKFHKASGDVFNDFVTAEKIMSFNNPVMQAIMYASTILICWFGAKIIVGSHETLLSTGELTSLISYSMSILSSLMMLSMIFVMLTMSRAAIERAYEVLTEESDIADPENPVTEVKDGSVKFNNVSFGYSKTGDGALCLTDVNIDIKSGETIGIIGGTGSSKSTLVQLIPRLYDVTSGSVEVGGVDVRNYSIHTLRDSVAMVLQKNVLFSGTIKDNLRWGNENATDEEMKHVCELACADEFIKEMPEGYDTYIEQGGTNVSGGQRQRLCIARALLKKPAILILDDSTSAVDTATDAKIRYAFRNEIPNTTKFIIAQRISSIQDADRIIVLDGGRINAIGTHEELLATNEIYKEVFTSQTKGGDFDGASK